MKDNSDVDGTIKQIISFEPSTMETIDYSVHDFVDKQLDIFCTTNKGFKKVPVIWQAAERAFQIKDDLLDIEGDEKYIGKKTNKDNTRGKETFISTLGSKNAKKKCISLINKAKNLLKPFGTKASRLILITDYIISRKK